MDSLRKSWEILGKSRIFDARSLGSIGLKHMGKTFGRLAKRTLTKHSLVSE